MRLHEARLYLLTLYGVRNIFYWLWPQIVQRTLDQFVDSWDYRRSGTASDINEQVDLNIPVSRSIVEELRSEIPVERENAFRFVDDDFKARMETMYANMGRPELSLSNGWSLFRELRNRIHRARLAHAARRGPGEKKGPIGTFFQVYAT